MKKILVLLFATMLCTSMDAQRNVQPQRGGGRSAKPGLAQKKHSFYLGFKGGVDFSTMSQPDECNLYDGAGLGFSGGIVGKARFGQATPNAPAGTGLLGAGLELKYKQNKVKTIGTDESGKANADMTVGYFEVPVYVQVYPFYRSDAMNTFYIEAGADFAGTISRSPKSLTVDNLKGEYSSVTYNLDSDNSKLKGMDVRIMAGVGYDFAIKNEKHETTNLIGINARYYMGTSKLAGNFNSKMSTLEISLSWMFNIGKL
jgi:hypothetical protein